ncbi:hypothetical protein LCGC14_0369970 [marine sediment metagenome]|uniref:HNH nuclease domain-containing protein n=1 Tax=marine sediment metagenome TaxID=412755 RepID=A0A0F9WE20_9ZZZZ
MPQIGEIRKGREIGRCKGVSKAGLSQNYIYHACEACGVERWVECVAGRSTGRRCRDCQLRSIHTKEVWGKVSKTVKAKNLRGERSTNWKGGYHRTPDGYMVMQLQPTDFYYPMANSVGIVREHRLVMARHLNRCLLPWEIVHHKNSVRDDNRLENLVLIKGHANHLPFTALRKENNQLKCRIRELEEQLENERKPL